MMQTIGVIGLGTMGLGIAQLYAAAGFSVIATDANAPARDSARTRMQTALNTRVTAGKLTETARDATLENLTITDDLATLKPCTMIIEAIIERLDAKQTI